MLLQEYDITFVQMKGIDNILTDAISRLHTINVYEEALEDHHLPKAQATTHVDKEVKQFQHIDSSPSQQLPIWTPQHCVIFKNKIS